MKLITFEHQGQDDWGVYVEGAGIVEGRNLADGKFTSIKQILAADALDTVRAALAGASATLSLSDIRFLPVIPDPDKNFCAGLNYRSHIEEAGRTPPKFPRFFVRVNNSWVGHGQPIQRPACSTRFDYEGELAVVIGKRGRHIAEENALDHIAGYTCFMDGSVRDWQEHTTTSGKNFFATGPLGPWMVTADEIVDPTALTLKTRLNGQEVQNAPTNMMIYSVATMINYLSTITWLEPGDIIATGTPQGVGQRREPPLWMKAGDVIEVEISSIGTLSNTVVDEE